MSTRWHMMSEKQLSILIQGRNYARGNRQIIRIPREFASISAGAPWLWRSVMQIDKVSQEPARLRMLTAPFHGTFFFPLEVHIATFVKTNDKIDALAWYMKSTFPCPPDSMCRPKCNKKYMYIYGLFHIELYNSFNRNQIFRATLKKMIFQITATGDVIAV